MFQYSILSVAGVAVFAPEADPLLPVNITRLNKILEEPAHIVCTGFPKKDARFSKLKNIPDLLSDEKDGKIMENINFSHFSNRSSFMGNPVYRQTYLEMSFSLYLR